MDNINNFFSKSQHLQQAKQSYTEHLKDSLHYSFISFKSAFYFLAHGINPNILTTNGSSEIYKLNHELQTKIKNMQNN